LERLGGNEKPVSSAKEFVDDYLKPTSPSFLDPSKAVHYAMPDFHKDMLDTVESGAWMLVLVPREFSKSTIVTIGSSVHRIVKNRNVCGGIISNTYDQAASFLKGVKSHLESNKKLIDEYGDFESQVGWRDDMFTVIRSNQAEINPTMFAAGAGKAILGKHTDFLVLDDVEDKKTVLTIESRRKTQLWYTQTVLPILRAGGQMIIIGTRKHFDDIYINILSGKLPGPSAENLKVIDASLDSDLEPTEAELIEAEKDKRTVLPSSAEIRHGWVSFPSFAKAIRDDGTSLWQEKWPLKALEERKRQMGPIAWAQEMENNPVPEENSYFTYAAFEECFDFDEKFQFTYSGNNPIFIGVDSQVNPDPKKSSDFGSIFVIEFIPETEDRRILWIERGRWGFRVVDKIKQLEPRYRPQKVKVENNQAQDYIIQELDKTSSIPVEGFTTGGQKPDIFIGIPYLAATVTSGKWIIPRGDYECVAQTDQWIAEALEYGQGHSGDTLMASWFANDCAREVSALGIVDLPKPDRITIKSEDFSPDHDMPGDEAQRGFYAPEMSKSIHELSSNRNIYSPLKGPRWRSPRGFNPAKREFRG